MTSQLHPSQAALFQAIDATWPPAQFHRHGIWTVREGQGGGQRVSAASTDGNPGDADFAEAEAALQSLNQPSLFVVRGDQPELDQKLADRGYAIKDPVDVLVAPIETLAQYQQSAMDVVFAAHAMPMLREIWSKGGIGDGRINVMERALGSKVYLMGRYQARACAAAFGAIHQGIMMVHAVEVLATARRKGIAERLMQGAAWWGQQEGATHFAVLTTSANAPAQKLYRKLGMEVASHYHYRVKASKEDELLHD